MNNVTVTGKMNFEAKIFKTNKGGKLATFQLGVVDGKGEDGKTNYTNITVKTFNPSYAESLENLGKGLSLVVVGKLVTEVYEVKGEKKYTTCIHAMYIGQEL